ncbi:MAG: hypothetical protein HYU27_01630 [Acidobacteria bacterium]|nr:hypothetical protein [Acidobacteriota bacterium]
MQLLVLVFLLSVGSVHAHAQARGGARGGRGAPPAARAAAPFDMTGYWVSIVTEDWRWRMFPNKGDYGGVPLNAEGRKIADSWDPAKDAAAGEQCKAYGAPGIMRIPGRFRITWQDDQTLMIEADAGKQTRTLYFGTPQGQSGTLQGVSKAEWEFPAPGLGLALAGGGARGGGSLKVTTTNLRPAYLRPNGVPYSANAKLTEYYDLVRESNGDAYLVLTSMIDDPAYLNQTLITAVHFKKQPDATGWNPRPCEAR